MSKAGRRAHRQNRVRNRLDNYSRRQPARALAAVLGVPMLVCLLAAISRPHYGLSLWFLSSLLLIVFVLFSSLTVDVTGTRLAWRFGPGLIRKDVALADVASATIIRTRLSDGLGIHYTRHGWFYSVSGRDAVAVVLRDGSSFALGTNDPVGLWEAIQQRIAPPPATAQA
ncbi:MAG: hypothetical protein REI09_08415 [Candidatus Dactylopiibacterium sp.]|nr:hypothetical protein [Candidatus Dactylopiibacterium sp.]